MPKKKVKNVRNTFFKGFSKIKFLDLYLQSQKKVMGYFRFFCTQTRLFAALYPTPCFKKKNPFHFYPLKVTTFHGDSVKNQSVGTAKLFSVKQPES